MEGIDETQATERSPVLKIFRQKRVASGAACRGPEKSIPERKLMILLCLYGFKQVFGVWRNDGEGLTVDVQGLDDLRGGNHPLSCCDSAELVQGLEHQGLTGSGGMNEELAGQLVLVIYAAIDGVDENVRVDGELTGRGHKAHRG